jgi:hypothetical protein
MQALSIRSIGPMFGELATRVRTFAADERVERYGEPVARALLGGLLMYVGGRRRSVFGALLATAGGVLVRSGITEGVRAAMSSHESVPFADLPEHRFGNGTRDKVDEASWESFPASDPPPFR